MKSQDVAGEAAVVIYDDTASDDKISAMQCLIYVFQSNYFMKIPISILFLDG